MSREDTRRRSRWVLRSMEWNDSRARYPNLWHEGMPRHVLAAERLAQRLRLGDLIAIFYPKSTRHPRRSERFLGISRVCGLRRGDESETAWVDLETAHRLTAPLAPEHLPDRVFLCCDAGWPERDIALFEQVHAASTADGWVPREEDRAVEAHPAGAPTPGASVARDSEQTAARDSKRPAARGRDEATTRPSVEPSHAHVAPESGERLFAGADYSGNMRDPRDATWLAVVGLKEDRFRVIRLDATGRSGLQSMLRNPQKDLMDAEAIGLGFPFGLPLDFAESLMGGPFPEEGWWALAKRLEQISWPDYLIALQEFRDDRGELMRLADERASAVSPLHRVQPDMGSRSYHGIRMIAEDRSRYAIRPFESAQGKLLFEVYPEAVIRKMGLSSEPGGRSRRTEIVSRLEALDRWPIHFVQPFRTHCIQSEDALDAIIAARCAAVAVLTAEANKTPEELAPEQAERVRKEGWIYGLGEPA